jgi:bifunctional non-homologous end joining protein LigD
LSKFEFTNLDKVFFKEAGFTKGDLVEYYQAVAKTMLPYLKDRPESLLRQPDGYNGMSFFQKDMGNKLPTWIKTKKIHSDSTDQDINYLVCNDWAVMAPLMMLAA